MKVKDFIMEGVKKGTLHASLLDPDKQSAEEAAAIAEAHSAISAIPSTRASSRRFLIILSQSP